MKLRLNIKIVFFLIILALLIKTTYALGVTPGRTTLNFEPGLEKTVQLTILNTEQKEFNALIYIEGDLKDYIKLDKTEISFSKQEESKTLTYTIKTPEKLSPGLNTANIIIREYPKETEGGLTVAVLVAVISQVYIFVPYPGKYIKADLNIVEANVNETIRFFIPITNLGEEQVNVKAAISIQDNNKEIARLITEPINLNSKEKRELSEIWTANIASGTYKAVAFIDYGKTITIEKEFLIGNFFLRPLAVSVKNFKLGEVAKFDVLMENIGNKDIKNAYSQIRLDDNEKLIANLKSDSISIKPKERSSTILFWDTENVQAGNYDGKLILHQDDKSIERQIKTFVSQNSINTEIIGITGQVIAPVEINSSKTSILLIIIIALLIVNILWFVYFKKKKK